MWWAKVPNRNPPIFFSFSQEVTLGTHVKFSRTHFENVPLECFIWWWAGWGMWGLRSEGRIGKERTLRPGFLPLLPTSLQIPPACSSVSNIHTQFLNPKGPGQSRHARHLSESHVHCTRGWSSITRGATSASLLASASCLAASLLRSGDTTSPTAKPYCYLHFHLLTGKVHICLWSWRVLVERKMWATISTETEPGENDSRYQKSKWRK